MKRLKTGMRKLARDPQASLPEALESEAHRTRRAAVAREFEQLQLRSLLRCDDRPPRLSHAGCGAAGAASALTALATGAVLTTSTSQATASRSSSAR